MCCVPNRKRHGAFTHMHICALINRHPITSFLKLKEPAINKLHNRHNKSTKQTIHSLRIGAACNLFCFSFFLRPCCCFIFWGQWKKNNCNCWKPTQAWKSCDKKTKLTGTGWVHTTQQQQQQPRRHSKTEITERNTSHLHRLLCMQAWKIDCILRLQPISFHNSKPICFLIQQQRQNSMRSAVVRSLSLTLALFVCSFIGSWLLLSVITQMNINNIIGREERTASNSQ